MLREVLLVLFPLLMIFAASSDLLSMTIANRVPLMLSAGFVLVAIVAGMPVDTMGAHLATGLICLVATFCMFSAGWMGGGDAKLLAATGLWCGPTSMLVEYVLLGAMYGGLLTLGLLICRSAMQPVTGVAFVDRLLHEETGIPYGIALGAAGLTVYSQSFWMDIAIKGLSAAPF